MIDLDELRESAEGARRRGNNLSVDPEDVLAFVDTVKAIRFFLDNQGQGSGGPMYQQPLVDALKKFKR